MKELNNVDTLQNQHGHVILLKVMVQKTPQ